MGIINRYIFFDFFPPFVINLVFFSFVFLMKQLLDITDLVVNHKVGLLSVFLLLIYTLPFLFQFVIPMSIMMAVLLTFMRMSSDNEILALKAGGLSIYRLLPPVILFSLFGTLITAYMSMIGVPLGTEKGKQLIFDVAASNLKISLKERTFNDSFKQIMLYVNRIDPSSGRLHSILIEDKRNPEANNTVIAKTGTIYSEPDEMIYHLRLYDGTINQLNRAERTSHTIHFNTYDIRLDLKTIMSRGGLSAKRPEEMTLPRLREHLQKVAEDPPEFRKALMHYHRKFSIPAACLAMGLLALPLGIQSKRSNKGFGIGLCLLFFLFYYIMLSAGMAYGEKGSIAPGIGMWLPNMILAGAGVYLLFQAAREKTMTFGWLDAAIDYAWKTIGKR